MAENPLSQPEQSVPAQSNAGAEMPPCRKRLRHDAYTIGWVCALPKEQTAARAMLDEEHEPLPTPRNDHNAYKLGSEITNSLVTAIEIRPSPLCYLHLLQGGGAVGDVAADENAFGCRDWDFACIVYNIAMNLLPLSSGFYGADLGPDPRDAALAVKAFGPNRPRLARLKHTSDPRNVLAYACPLSKAPMEPRLIILVTGDSCAGKDYCADVWVSMFLKCTQKGLVARAVSISDATKREYAAATGADLNCLRQDRAYKEQHRSALTTFFQHQVPNRPRLPEEHFLNVVYGAADVDVLLITGMRDEAPVAAMSHLVPDSRLLE
ncbi:hypothetical protein N7517_008135 [Penicillium concentricum]|uniref:Uncharacterized protein n=1 Tax=Penicillium concentricum TaxID=293559 RepID=A0A9W9RU12_9EURO|nr:uncharacterized protein N7517_008135 [Penicillium concentricum]KAJ5365249.1 hypothetical protein N7517_008135 [Penicillium concentricum]